jgi:hypothetical protein
MRNMLKVVFVIIVLVMNTPFCLGVNLAVNGGFETSVDTTALYPPFHAPTNYGYWTGDAVQSTGTANWITPYEGSQMLSFLFTESAVYPDSGGWMSTICQSINVSPYLDAISTGNATAKMSARFNRVLGDSQTDTQFSIQIYAFEGDYTTLQEQYILAITTGQELACVTEDIFTDGDIATWEFANVELTLPSTTDFVAIFVHAKENVFNDSIGVDEFDGHYVDAVTFEIVPEPATLLLLGLGAGILRKKSQR